MVAACLAVAGGWLGGCPVELEGLPCPCGETGYECCDGICVLEGTCAAAPQDAGPADRDGGPRDADVVVDRDAGAADVARQDAAGGVDAGADAGPRDAGFGDAAGPDVGSWGSGCDFPGDGPWCKVIVSWNSSCGLTKYGTVRCWGQPLNSPANVDVRDIALASGDLCIIKVGGIHVCMPIYPDPAPAETAIAVVAGNGYRCILTPEHRVRCWSIMPLEPPVDDGEEVYASQISGNQGDFCAVSLDDQTLYCPTPNVADPPGGVYSQVSVGWNGACAVAADDGHIECWGLVPPPAPAGNGYDAVATGNEWGCALRGGLVECFGNPDEQVEPFVTDAPPAAEGPFRMVWADDDHACAVTTDDHAVCWGMNDHGQIDVPAVVPP